MERNNWDTEKPRLSAAMARMETWASMLLQSVQETHAMIEAATDDFIFQPESHPVGVPEFEMAMREVDSSLREILAIHQAIQENYREGLVQLNTGKLLEKPEISPEEIAEVLTLVQDMTIQKTGDEPTVCIVAKDKIEIQIEPDNQAENT